MFQKQLIRILLMASLFSIQKIFSWQAIGISIGSLVMLDTPASAIEQHILDTNAGKQLP
jgi:hypothetical protein